MPSIDSARARVGARLRDPVAWTEALQLVKTVVAAVVAWMLATMVFDLPQSFLAPWSALLVVHSTVYRTFSQGMQHVAATVVGVFLAWGVGSLLGLDPFALTVLMLLALMLGRITALKLDGTDTAATAVIVLTIGYVDDGHLLVNRFLDTAVGIGVGLLVNLLVWPPLRDVSAARAIDNVHAHIGDLLQQMARQLREGCDDETVQEWLEEVEAIDDDIDEAWALLRQARESAWYNPRPAAIAAKNGEDWDDSLRPAEQAVADIGSMARTLGQSLVQMAEWQTAFRERWVSQLELAGAAIRDSDADRVAAVRDQLNDLAHELSNDNLPANHWSVYGALLLNLRHIVTSMHPVALRQ